MVVHKKLIFSWVPFVRGLTSRRRIQSDNSAANFPLNMQDLADKFALGSSGPANGPSSVAFLQWSHAVPTHPEQLEWTVVLTFFAPQHCHACSSTVDRVIAKVLSSSLQRAAACSRVPTMLGRIRKPPGLPLNNVPTPMQFSFSGSGEISSSLRSSSRLASVPVVVYQKCIISRTNIVNDIIKKIL